MPGRAVTRPSPRAFRARAGVPLAAAALLAVTAAPSAAAGWGAAVDLSEPVRELSAGPPQLAGLESGRVLVAWRQPESGGPLNYAVEAAVRPAPRRAWQRTGPLGPAVQYPYMSLGTGASRAVLALRGAIGSAPSGGPFPVAETRALARVLDEDGRWTRATLLSSPRRIASAPQGAVDGAGVALVAWHEAERSGVGGPSPGDVRIAIRPPGGAWTGPTLLSASGSYEPAITAGAAGSLVVWVTDEPGGAAVWVRERSVGGDWGPPHRLSGPPAAIAAPGVAVNPAGEAVVAWHEGGAVLAATRDRAGRWAAPTRISGDQPAMHKAGRPPPPLAIDDAGTVLVAWRAAAAAGILDVRAATRVAGRSWSAPEILSQVAGRSTGVPALALRDGRAVVAWPQPRGRRTVLMAREGDLAHGTWAPPQRVSPPGEAGTAPALLLDARGGAICAYVAIRRATPDRRVVVRVVERPPAPRSSRPVRLAREQLLVNQRISQAALRRGNAVLARLDEGLTAADIRLGSLAAASFGPGVTVGGLEAADVVDPGPPAPIRTAAAARRTALPELSAEQLLVNQRIAQAAVRRTTLARRRLAFGLTGADVRDGALGGEHLAPGLAIVSADGAEAPAPRPAAAQPTSGVGGGVRLSREQLLINQRISQAAVRRANELVARMEGGLGADDFRPGSLGGADLRPDAR